MPIHPVLARELRQSKRLQKFFDSLPESSRDQIDREVREVKKEETRLRRAQHAAEYLMEAMEAELDPPPPMKAALHMQRQSRKLSPAGPIVTVRESVWESRSPHPTTRKPGARWGPRSSPH